MADETSSLTVAKLKALCVINDLPTSGKKAELVERLLEAGLGRKDVGLSEPEAEPEVEEEVVLSLEDETTISMEDDDPVVEDEPEEEDEPEQEDDDEDVLEAVLVADVVDEDRGFNSVAKDHAAGFEFATSDPAALSVLRGNYGLHLVLHRLGAGGALGG